MRITLRKEKGHALLSVMNDGEEIPPEQQKHLFERFYRGKNAESSSFGIGLALAQSIMSRQNGIIRAENRTGGGSVFRIRFYRQNV